MPHLGSPDDGFEVVSVLTRVSVDAYCRCRGAGIRHLGARWGLHIALYAGVRHLCAFWHDVTNLSHA